MEEWEYWTGILEANIDSEGVRDFIQKRWPDWKKPPIFAPQTLMPTLNEFGKKGRELMHIESVHTNRNGGIEAGGGTGVYFCVFKRRVVAKNE